MSQLLEYALKYASMGWEIFPLQPGKKEPLPGTHGVKDATSVESVILGWWKTNPLYNIGLACGYGSGIYVVDVDEKRDEKGKIISDGKIEYSKRFPPLPATMIQTTPRRGLHYLFHHPLGNNDPIGNRVNIVPSVDIRGDGGYIVLTPSHLDPYTACPGGGFYEWIGGCAPWERATAEYPSHLLPVSKPVMQAKLAAAVDKHDFSPPLAGSTSLNNRILDRARLYIHECDPAVEGMGGHAKLLWAAQCMVAGFCLSDSQALTLLASDYNPCCSPPWDLAIESEKKDFYRKITEARKNPPRDKPIGWLLTEYSLNDEELLNASRDVGDMIRAMNEAEGRTDFDQLLEDEETEVKGLEVELGFLTKPTGLLGEICSWINSTSLRYQPLLTLGCSITFLGALFGRKVRDTLGNRTNLYCMGIGDSSAGKGHGPEQIQRLCEAANCLDLIGGCNTTSDSGIEERLSRFPSTLFFWDEIGHLLSDFRSGNHKTLIVPTLMSIWSSAKRTYLGREYANSDNQRRIVQPNCCIWGSTTPDRFSRGLSPEELRDGWIGRVLAYQTNTKPPVNDDYVEEPVPEHLIAACHEWMGRGEKTINGTSLTNFATSAFTETPPEQIIVPLTKEARLVMKAFRALSEKKAEEQVDTEYLWAKAVEQAHRVALIVAASEGTPEIEVSAQVADYSCRLVAYLVDEFGKTILPNIAGSELELAKLKVIETIGRYGKKGCPKWLLTRKTQWASGTARDGMLKDLLEGGQLRINKKGNGLVYWTEENYMRLPK